MSTSLFSDDEVPVNGAQMTEVEREIRRSDVLQASLRLMASHVLSGGIRIQINDLGRRRRTEEWFESLVDQYWMPFARAALESIYKWGFVVVIFGRPDTKSRDRVPVVAPHGRYRVMMKWQNNMRQYLVYDQQSSVSGSLGQMITRSGRVKGGRTGGSGGPQGKPVRALVFDPFPPDDDGTLKSPIMSVLEQVKSHREMQENMRAAAFWRARPPGVYERVQSRERIPDDPMAAALAVERRTIEAEIGFEERGDEVTREQHAADVLELARQLSAQQSLAFRREQFNERTGAYEKLTRSPPWQATTISVPNGQRATNVQLPESQQELVNLLQLQQTNIAIGLGIPSQLLYNDHQVHAANVKLTLVTFNRYVLDLQEHLRRMFTRIYYELYQDVVDKTRVMRVLEAQERLPERRRLLTNAEIRIILKSVRVEVSFGYSPVIEPEQVMALRDAQFLDHDTAGEYVLGTLGIPREKLLTQRQIERTAQTAADALAADAAHQPRINERGVPVTVPTKELPRLADRHRKRARSDEDAEDARSAQSSKSQAKRAKKSQDVDEKKS